MIHQFSLDVWRKISENHDILRVFRNLRDLGFILSNRNAFGGQEYHCGVSINNPFVFRNTKNDNLRNMLYRGFSSGSEFHEPSFPKSKLPYLASFGKLDGVCHGFGHASVERVRNDVI